jgi:hypothetical protein
VGIASWRKLSVGEAVTRMEGKGASAGEGWVVVNPPDLEKAVVGDERRYRKCERNEAAGRIEGG